MKISIATSVFCLRKTRPLNYYLKPAQEFLEDMRNSEIDIHLFTNQNSSHFPEGKNIHIYHPKIDDLIKFFWDDPNWRKTYSHKLSDRPADKFEEKTIPELIGIWLGKFTMVHEVSKNCDCVLWQDSGIRMGVFNKDFSNYKKCKSRPWLYQSALSKLAQKHPLTLLSTDLMREYFHGVKMNEYDNFQPQLCRAGLFLVNSKEAKTLKFKIAKYWNIMLDKDHYGTEENPLTIYSWERKDFRILSYKTWLSVLGIGGLEHDSCRLL